MTEQERHRSRGLKWKFALMSLACFVAFICGGSDAYGGLSSGSNGPPRPKWHKSPQSKTGRESKTDGLGMNFFFHSYSGGAYFNSARADRGQVTSIHDLDWLHKDIGPARNKIFDIFKPRIAAKLFSALNLGFGYLYCHQDDYLRVFPKVHKRNSEQKLYLMLYF